MPPNSKSNKVVRVIDPPCRVDSGYGGISRGVELADGGGRVETWHPIKKCWEPGGNTLKGVAMGTPCPDPEAA